MSQATLLDVAKLNMNDKVVGLIEENLTYAPELEVFPARTIKGTQYKTVIRTGFPTVGFRAANDGLTPGKSTFRNALVECFILSSIIQVDKNVAMAYEDGPEAWEMIEASGVVKQAMITAGKQIWYGTLADANGFAGIKSLLPKTGAGSAITVNAGGTTASTASSVYAVKLGLKDTQLVVGQNGQMSLSPFRDQQIAGATANTWMPGRVSDLAAWVGLQVGNGNCVGRILNLTADSGKTLTDALISQLLANFPVGYWPDYLFMSRRSANQLQQARTVVINTFGANNKPNGTVENIAPWPTSAFGIPIVVTDSILNTDTIE